MRLNQPADTESNGQVHDVMRGPSQELRDATNPPTTDDRTIVELCDAYLTTLHSGSWGRTFYIHDADGRRAAAEFLATTIEGVMEHAKQR